MGYGVGEPESDKRRLPFLEERDCLLIDGEVGRYERDDASFLPSGPSLHGNK